MSSPIDPLIQFQSELESENEDILRIIDVNKYRSIIQCRVQKVEEQDAGLKAQDEM